MATSETENKRLIERALQAWDEWDMQVVEAVHAEDVVSHGSDADSLDDFKALLADWYDAFPDLTHTIEDLVAEGDKVAFRFTVTGTHEGMFQGIDPTGEEIEMDGMAVYRVEDGQIVEQLMTGDALALYHQLDAVDFPTA